MEVTAEFIKSAKLADNVVITGICTDGVWVSHLQLSRSVEVEGFGTQRAYKTFPLDSIIERPYDSRDRISIYLHNDESVYGYWQAFIAALEVGASVAVKIEEGVYDLYGGEGTADVAVVMLRVTANARNKVVYRDVVVMVAASKSVRYGTRPE